MAEGWAGIMVATEPLIRVPLGMELGGGGDRVQQGSERQRKGLPRKAPGLCRGPRSTRALGAGVSPGREPLPAPGRVSCASRVEATSFVSCPADAVCSSGVSPAAGEEDVCCSCSSLPFCSLYLVRNFVAHAPHRLD